MRINPIVYIIIYTNVVANTSSQRINSRCSYDINIIILLLIPGTYHIISSMSESEVFE